MVACARKRKEGARARHRPNFFAKKRWRFFLQFFSPASFPTLSVAALRQELARREPGAPPAPEALTLLVLDLPSANHVRLLPRLLRERYPTGAGGPK